MADDDSNNSDKEKENNVSYVRKKNVIQGIDNDQLIIWGLAGLTALTLAPHAKNFIDGILRNLNLPQLQRPPNGMASPTPTQQPVYLPPEPQVQPPTEAQAQQPNMIHEHERAVEEQKAYEAAVEKENVTGAQGISMVPDRSTQVAKQQKKSTYEAGSNISGSYS